jgi:hypothetical protein
MITYVTQSDLFSGGTENNHDNINKDGSLLCEFSTHEFPVWSRRAAGSVSLALFVSKKLSDLVDGCLILLCCYNQQNKGTVHFTKRATKAER